MLPTPGEQVGEALVLEDRSQRVPHAHVGSALREGGLGDASGLLGDRIYGTGMQAHDLSEGLACGFPSVCEAPGEFASSI
jgi:FAD synthase